MKHKVKLAIILAVEFIAIAVVLVLIFISGKKQYTVRFDLDGGILVSGSIEQSVTQGHNATPPVAVKEGHFLRGWHGSYTGVTHDTTVTAIWEYVTTPGIEYTTKEGATYTEISGCFKHLKGKLYIGAYHEDMIVLGILDSAFEDCEKVTNIYLLDGILSIGDRAFANCKSLESIELPGTVTVLGSEVFAGCESLESIRLPEDVEIIGERAFAGCTSLKEVYIPSTVQYIAESAFEGLTSLKKVVFYDNEQAYLNKEETETEEDEDEMTDTLGETADETEEESGMWDEAHKVPKPCRTPTVIGYRAFAGCTALKTVKLCDSPLRIEAEAFADCTKLQSLTIPKGTLAIESGAFNTEDLEILMEFDSKADLPDGFAEDWYHGDVKVTYLNDRNAEEESEIESDSESETDGER